MGTLDPIVKQKYLSLETYRKTGEGIKTPVWFVVNEKKFYVITMADSWKVKRIRRDNRVKVAPCRVNGLVIGDWQQAEAFEITDPVIQETVNHLYRKKYGLLHTFYERQRKKDGNKSTTLEITILEIVT